MKPPLRFLTVFAAFVVAAVSSVLAAAAPAAAAPAESSSVLLQRGIFAEETQRDLDAAIRIYEQIAAQSTASRSILATAQYRLAVVYQKKGNTAQAIAALNDLLRQFPAEAVTAQKARELLVQLGAKPAEMVSLRAVPIPGIVRDVSADGRFFVYPAQGTPGGINLDLMVFDSATGRTSTTYKWAKGEESVSSVSISRDGSQVGYVRGGDVFVARPDGSETRRVFHLENWGDDDSEIYARGMLPDGEQMIVIHVDPKNQTSIAMLNLKTGALTEFKKLPGLENIDSDIRAMRLSNSGRYLAYQAPLDQGRIKIIDLTSNAEHLILERGENTVVGWAPDDSKVLYLSGRQGITDLYAVAVQNGRAVGEPQLIKSGMGDIAEVHIVSNGSLFYCDVKQGGTVQVATVNFQTGEVSSAPQLLSRYRVGQTALVWSADSQRVIMAIQANDDNASPHKSGFVSVSVATGDVVDFGTTAFGPNYLEDLAWSPDQSFVLLSSGAGASNRYGIHRYDLTTGKVDTLVADDNDKTSSSRPQITRDGESFVYERREFGASPPETIRDQILRRDFRSGREAIVYTYLSKQVGPSGDFRISPDGTEVAVVDTDGSGNQNDTAAIKIVTLNGGVSRELIRFGPKEYVTLEGWTPAGLIYVKGGKVWAISAAAGAPVQLQLPANPIFHLAVSPDGQKVAYYQPLRAGTPTQWDTPTEWVLEGLLPKLVANPGRAAEK